MPTDEAATERSFMQPQEMNQRERSHKKYNINKYKEVERTTAQVEPEGAIQKLAEEQPRNINLSHPNLEVQKFVIDIIWRTIIKRQRGDDFVFSSDNFIKFWALITQNDEEDVEIVDGYGKLDQLHHITAKSGVFHAGDYVVGLSQGSLVLHSSGIVYSSVYLHWTSKGVQTSIPVTVGYVDAEFIPHFSDRVTMQH
ncbi:MAG: hypothetical protein EZS28_024121 [Streblomastix strix]|uniref:Uncharacterized protein n=1 Tax=Streblomastix strix TaxID=222440 RepID=A0A5J4VCZ8_9EUKA|nr:MAG: hypothetical protein EZS28_024121 [Streblomastix strix]